MTKLDLALESAVAYPAWARLYARMFKQFEREYKGSLRAREFTTKQREQLSLQDLRQDYVRWITLNGRKIGYALCPTQTDQEGNIVGRYLDTRWIEPKYRGRGIGGSVLKLLLDTQDINSVKINTLHLEQTDQWWCERGFRRAVPAWCIDSNFEPEKTMENREYMHWYLLHDTSPELSILEAERHPMLDLERCETINKPEVLTR